MYRVILIGGTSHTGKSTLAQSLASHLGWQLVSTDNLARHPGRPWRELPDRVPEHVAEHYGGALTVEELLEEVLRHYQKNVWPQVEKIVSAHVDQQINAGLVLEGSALWPSWVNSLECDNVVGIWLTAGSELIRERIYQNSRYDEKSPLEKRWIDQFLARSIAFDAALRNVVDRLGVKSIDVGSSRSTEWLVSKCWECLR